METRTETKNREIKGFLKDFAQQHSALNFKLKFGKYAGHTLREMLNHSDKTKYLQWMRNNSKTSNFMKHIITEAANEMLEEKTEKLKLQRQN